jgi:pantoate--beta-alanine ligase
VIPTASSIFDVRTAMVPWREAGETVAFVPTMGALHRGHMALIAEAKKMARRVVASIFVNPTQFAPNEDLAKYPRRLEDDKKLLAEAGCDLLYAPSAEDMYPAGFVSAIDPGTLATVLEGIFRPTHFRGVATVVVKLLLQILPDAALFGEKDYQQLLVIRQVVRDLNIPIHIIGVPIVRDADGLALSSRNAYLSPADRQHALALPRTLKETAIAIQAGRDIGIALADGMAQLVAAGFSVDYLELANAATLAPTRTLNLPARLLAAGFIGTTRLIDNCSVP